MADARDLKSRVLYGTCGFESRLGHSPPPTNARSHLGLSIPRPASSGPSDRRCEVKTRRTQRETRADPLTAAPQTLLQPTVAEVLFAINRAVGAVYNQIDTLTDFTHRPICHQCIHDAWMLSRSSE